MNERIRELAEQAFFDEATSEPSNKMYTFSDHKMKKFAELIVRECMNATRGASTGLDAFNNIKEHFGVE